MSRQINKGNLSLEETLGLLENITTHLGKIERMLVARGFPVEETAATTRHEKDLRVDPTTLTVVRGHANSASLTAKELQIMTLLNEAFDRTISRRLLVSRVWGGSPVSSKTLDVHIFNLRRKLQPLKIEIQYQAPDSFRMVLREMEREPAAPEADAPAVPPEDVQVDR
jgi:DNA-binding response OmpR family regulator